MRPHSGIPPTKTLPQMSKDRTKSATSRSVRSKYTLMENSLPQLSNKPKMSISRHNKSQETNDSLSAADEGRMKDILFVRKMLVMNKKQELLLSKRLANLLEEEDETKKLEQREKSTKLKRNPSHIKLLAKYENNTCDHIGENTIPETHSKGVPIEDEVSVDEKTTLINKTEKKDPNDTPNKTAAAKKMQYDLNGRRIYYYDDLEDERKDDELNLDKIPIHFNEYSEINKTPVNPKKKQFKKSATYIKKHGSLERKPMSKDQLKVRKEGGNFKDCNVENSLGISLNSGSGGDGKNVQTIVVNCSTVVKSCSTPKKNLKVWNYERLSDSRCENRGNSENVLSDDSKQNSETLRNKRSNRPLNCDQ
ncbi:uncharacterized protein LOC128987449 isoform X2 [Macrosteles quadrilineatus]|nr:uncharacterized protein LOC128987449 isoform X2 [Macrosteles quadrilineatus]